MLIDESELRRVTGYKQRSAIKEHLKSNGIPFRVGQGGRIWTTQSAIDATLSGKTKKRRGPNFDALTPVTG